MKTINNKEDLLREMSWRYYGFSICDPILPCTTIARCYNISLYKARKLMKELVQDGLACRSFIAIYDEYNCENRCLHGFMLTEKGKDTEIFKQIQKEFEDRVKDNW